LSFFQHGDIAPDMSRHDIELCKSVEQKLRARDNLATRPLLEGRDVEFIDEKAVLRLAPQLPCRSLRQIITPEGVDPQQKPPASSAEAPTRRREFRAISLLP